MQARLSAFLDLAVMNSGDNQANGFSIHKMIAKRVAHQFRRARHIHFFQ